jgi:hypothetical protein
MVKTHVEESLGANPGDAALNPADSVAMGVPAQRSPGGVLPPRSGMFHAFHHKAFRLLFAAFLINQTGFWVSHISLQGLMVELTDNDTVKNGVLFFVLFLPAFLLAPSRVSRRTASTANASCSPATARSVSRAGCSCF